jgi:hypothetical protein
VSKLLAHLQQLLQRFDEEGFVALANRGLLRRAQKDLQAQAAEIAEEGAEKLVVAFGGHRIAFDRRGPAFAECSCPAAAVCQHVLAASLFLRDSGPPAGAAPAEEVAGAPPAPAAASAPDLEAQMRVLAATTPEQLRKHAGLPGYRWAYQHALDLEPAQDLQIDGENHVVLRLSRPRLVFRALGEGIEGLVADAQVSQLPKYRVAAILLLQRALGHALQAPPSSATRAPQLDLGQDHALAEGRPATQLDSRRRVRRGVQELVQDCLRLGLSHLSEAVQQRFATLAVWAQGAEYYRLAMLLRRLADHVEMLLERAGGADEHALFDELSLASALVAALDAAAARGEEPRALVGRARTRYEESGALSLVGLGAWPWRSQTGYHGLTMLLWCEEESAFVTCTDARPEQQRGFDPRTRFTQYGPWGGLGAPQQAMAKRVRLSGARLNDRGRVSANESATAQVQVGEASAALLEKLQPLSSWQEVHERWEANRRSLLAEPDPMRDWVVLQVARLGEAAFDATRQVFDLPLLDAEGNALVAELAYSELNEHAIDRLESLHKAWPADGAALVGRLRNADGHLLVEPVSLLRVSATGELQVDAIHFDEAQHSVRRFAALFDIFRGRPAGNVANVVRVAADPVPRALRELRNGLCRRAERGLPQDAAFRADGEFRRLSEAASTAGFACLPELSGEPDVAQLVRANYIYLQYVRLLGGSGSDSAAEVGNEGAAPS